MKKTIFLMIVVLMSVGMVYSSITVRRPGNGVNWPLGKKRHIRWTASRGGADFKLVLFKDGRKLGNIANNVSSMRRSYLWTVGQYEGGIAPVGSGYQIKVKRIGEPDAGMSDGTFNIALGVLVTANTVNPEEGIRILSPVRGDRLRSFSNTTIKWRMPIGNACGDKVELSVVKVGSGFTYYPIAQNVSCSAGENSYSWIVRSPDFTGTAADFRIRILSDSCRNESDPFQIVSSMENTDDTRSDYHIDSVTLSNGLSLDRGLNYSPGNDISHTFQVNVKWNKVEPSSAGNHSVQVKSVLTDETIHLSNSPAHFSFEDADSSTGMIRILVPFNIPHDKVESMIRDRFIPLAFRLVFNPSSCDNFASNNNKELNLRILNAPQFVNLVAEIDESSLSLDIKRTAFDASAAYRKVKFSIRVKVKNLNAPSPRLKNVNCPYVIKYWYAPESRWIYNKRKNLVFESVGNSWTWASVSEEFRWHKNNWADFHFVIHVDREKKFKDTDRDNNVDELIFNIRGK
jgi:hypothetical protein